MKTNKCFFYLMVLFSLSLQAREKCEEIESDNSSANNIFKCVGIYGNVSFFDVTDIEKKQYCKYDVTPSVLDVQKNEKKFLVAGDSYSNLAEKTNGNCPQHFDSDYLSFVNLKESAETNNKIFMVYLFLKNNLNKKKGGDNLLKKLPFFKRLFCSSCRSFKKHFKEERKISYILDDTPYPPNNLYNFILEGSDYSWSILFKLKNNKFEITDVSKLIR